MANKTRSRSTRVTSSYARNRSSNGRRRAHSRDDESIAAWFGELFTGNEGGKRRSTRSTSSRAGSKSASKSASKSNNSRKRSMSRSEAGRAGGLAPHRCRGRECSSMSSSSWSTRSKSNGRAKSRSR